MEAEDGSSTKGEFVWPKHEDIVTMGIQSVLCKLPAPYPVSNRHIGWSDADISHIFYEYFF